MIDLGVSLGPKKTGSLIKSITSFVIVAGYFDLVGESDPSVTIVTGDIVVSLGLVSLIEDDFSCSFSLLKVSSLLSLRAKFLQKVLQR